jgi:hypothetical protein
VTRVDKVEVLASLGVSHTWKSAGRITPVRFEYAGFAHVLNMASAEKTPMRIHLWRLLMPTVMVRVASIWSLDSTETWLSNPTSSMGIMYKT